MPRRALGAAALAGAAVGGAALGYLAERRALRAPQASAPGAPLIDRGTPIEVVSHDGTRLHAEAHGPEGAPTWILAHGVGLSSAVWHQQRRALSDEYRVVAYDHRGHGGSERADDCSIEALGHDLAAVIERCAPHGDVLLAGHSMGGMAILSLAEHHPGLVSRRVAGAVLCNTAARALVGSAAAGSVAAALGALQARLSGSRLGRARPLEAADPDARPSTDLSLLLTRHLGMTGDAPQDIVDFLERQLRATPPVVMAAFAPGLAGVNLADAAASLKPPALVIVGARDRVTPPSQGRKLAAALPSADLLELEGVGHTAMLEAPDAVTSALREFASSALGRAVA